MSDGLPKFCNVDNCSITNVLRMIGGKWKPIIIYVLLNKEERFQEIWRKIPEISKKVLASQLKELEGDGLVSRKVLDTSPPGVEYSLTTCGRSLEALFRNLMNWSVGNPDVVGDTGTAAVSREGEETPDAPCFRAASDS